MERIKQNHTLGNKGHISSTRREGGRCREEPVTCRERRSSQREFNSDKNQTSTPKHNQSPTTPTPQRSRLKRRLQNANNKEDKDKSKDIEEVIIEKDKGVDCGKLAGVLDCGVSVSWKPAKDAESIKDKWTDAEKEQQQHSGQKRRRKEAGSQCNGSTSPRRHRESVLRLTGEDGRNAGPAPASCSLGESEEDGDVENLEHNIVQFTVGEDDKTAIVVPIISSHVEAGDSAGTPKQSPTTKSTDPIVLSSDEDDESGNVSKPRRPSVHREEDTVIQKQSSLEALVEQQKASGIQEIQVLHVVEEKPVGSVGISAPRDDFSCMRLAFSSLYCGEYYGKANGNIVVGDEQITIPLTDTSNQVELMLKLERKELRRYSVWEQQEMEMRELYFKDADDLFPDTALLFCVSQTAAATAQRELCKLYAKQPQTTDPDKASPFILLTLKDPLEGMEGALLRSLLDIDCLNSLTQDQSIEPTSEDRFSYWEDINTPVLSLDDSIELIKRTGLDSHLLSLLGVETTEPELNMDVEDDFNSDIDENTLHNQLEVEPPKETVMELETAPEQGTEMQLNPEEERKEEEVEHPPEEKKEEPSPVYTLCHRRTKGSYSVSLLIQFPPPPLKGGITVTMEDLQCLDNGQYLLQNVSSAVAERTHIFSSFFYKQLTRRDNASEGTTSDSCQRQRRHQRVKTWTRHVDIFKKDFLFVPVNQEAHWYLVVICFPGLDEPRFEAWTGLASKAAKSHSGTDESQDQEETQGSKSPNNNTETAPTINHSDEVDAETEKAPEESTKDPPPGRVNCTEKTFQKKAVCKRPCILIMDSLKLSLHERVFKLLREYLQSEWEVRRGSSREFGPDQMKSSHCQVPFRTTAATDPVVHFDLPLHLQRWFPRQKVRRKRDEIRDLVLKLYRQQNLDNR
ncbi:hypothetical protein INR49_030402 [Caranx melampygus]|nr:hypothetical protein INR49_030402 [Caranx melampygus]